MNTTELLDLVIAKAPQLRAAGVSRLQFPSFDADGLGVTVVIKLREPEAAPIIVERTSRPYRPESNDPLYDAATYGGDGVPGFDLSNLDKPDEEDE